MQQLTIYIAIALFLTIVSTSAAQTGKVPPRNHILLLDASGSMKNQYLNGLRDWLINPLLNSGVFNANDRVIVRTFDKRGNNNFMKDDAQRRYQGQFDAGAILNTIPDMSYGFGRNTAIAEALEITLADIAAYNLTDDTLIYLITDNVEDVTDSGDDSILHFYQRIYNDTNFKFIYFFPLVREIDATALVMYVFDYVKTDTSLPMANLMDQVGKAINQRAVLFRPIRLSAVELERNGISLEAEDGSTQPAELEDGRVVIPLNSGQALNGRLKFKLRSRFREWKITQANISNASASIESSAILDNGGEEKLQWQLDPRTLDIAPQEVSKKIYTINLASGGHNLTPISPSFWQSFFVEPEIAVRGTVRFEIENPQLRLLFFDDAQLADRIKRVKGLEEIEKFLLPSNLPTVSRNLALEIPILLKINQPQRPLWVLIVIAVLILAAMLAGLLLLSAAKPFRLVGPNGERFLKLRLFAQTPLIIEQEQVGILARRFGSFTIRAFPPFVLENGTQKQHLSDHSSTFVITNSDNRKSWTFSLAAFSAEEKAATDSSDLFVS